MPGHHHLRRPPPHFLHTLLRPSPPCRPPTPFPLALHTILPPLSPASSDTGASGRRRRGVPLVGRPQTSLTAEPFPGPTGASESDGSHLPSPCPFPHRGTPPPPLSTQCHAPPSLPSAPAHHGPTSAPAGTPPPSVFRAFGLQCLPSSGHHALPTGFAVHTPRPRPWGLTTEHTRFNPGSTPGLQSTNPTPSPAEFKRSANGSDPSAQRRPTPKRSQGVPTDPSLYIPKGQRRGLTGQQGLA